MMKRPWIYIGIALVFLGVVFFIWRTRSNSSDVRVRESQIKRGEITLKILATGTVQPENRLEIKPPISGRIEQVLVVEGQKVVKGQILAWLSSTERAAMLDAARTQGPEEVKKWEDLYKPTPVVAPLNGTIIRRNVESGQTFTASEAVLVMSDRLTVKAQVDETDLAKIKLKQISEIRLDAYPDQAISARVDQIAYEAKTVNNVTTYLIDVLPDKAPDFMRSGMTANVTFIGETKQNILIIPNEFLRYDNGRPLALLKADGPKPIEKELQIGLSDGKNSEVISGLEEGDTVVFVLNKKDAKGSNPFSSMPRPRGGH